MTTIDRELLEQAARQLRTAATSSTVCAPVRDIVGTATDIDAGYAIQQINTDLDIAAGRRVSGRKIGVTSKAVQEQIGVDQPDFGTLFADMEFGDGIELPADRLLQPRAEAEVALVLEHDLDKGEHSFADIIRATAFALPSIEVVDSRIGGWDIRIVDTVADNASCGLYVLGGKPVALERCRPPHHRDVDVDRRHRGVERSRSRLPRPPPARCPMARRHHVRPQHAPAGRRCRHDRCTRTDAANRPRPGRHRFLR